MSDTPLVVAPRGRDVIGFTPTFAAALFVVAAFGVLSGPAGAAAGLVTGLVLITSGPLLAFIAGTVALLGVGEMAGLSVLPAHLVLTSYLVAGVYSENGRRIGVLAAAVVAIYVGLFVMGQSLMSSLTQTAAVLAGLAALGSYGIHRYERVVLGLVDE